jgi:urease accessory protein
MPLAGIITMTTMTITTEASLLRLLAWLSPAFPTGAFAYSHGLEWAVEAGDVRDETSLFGWLTDVMTHGTGRTDTILLRHAHRTTVDRTALPSAEQTTPTCHARLAVVDPSILSVMAGGGPPSTPYGAGAKKGADGGPPPPMTKPNLLQTADVTLAIAANPGPKKPANPTLTDIANLALATASGRERRAESLDQGKAFMLAAAPWGIPDAPEQIPYAVAVGAVAGTHGVPEDAIAVAFVQAVASNLISAAVRLVPLGQTAGLRALAALEPVIIATAVATRGATLDDIGGCAFRSDLSAMRHETQYTRLFRT